MKNKREVFHLEETGKEEQRKQITGMKMLVSSLLMVGFLLSFYAFYYTLPNFWLILMVGLGVVNILILCQNSHLATLVSIIAAIALAVVLIVVNLAGFSNSLIYFLNQFITVWNSRFDTFYALFALSGCTGAERLLFWVFWILIGALILSRLVNGGYRLILTVLTMGLLCLSIAMHVGLGDFGAVFTIIGWFSFWGMNVMERQHIVKMLGIITLLTICCSIVAIGTNHYKEVQSIASLKKSIVDGVEKARYGEDTLPQGDLTKAYEMVGDESETLKLTFDEAQEMYLRGFIGSDYVGNAWKEASGGIYVQEDTSGMLDWLKEEGFQTIYQYAEYQKAIHPDVKASNTLSVENFGAYRGYLYTPYELDAQDLRMGFQEKDWQLRSNALLGAKDYSYKLMEPNMPSELIIAQPIESQTEQQKKYVSAENVYRTFAYQNYLELSDDETALMKELIYNNQDWSNATIYQLTTQIRLALQGMVKYSDNPYAYGGNEDFVNWFINKGKLGNSAYYATVATLAYRAMGIPARYVEGYYLTDAEATSLNSNQTTEKILTQKNAHAWTEVYMDEVGWMPVEVVPGFYMADYTTQNILDLPQSSVTIQNQNDNDELQGSTTDKIPKKEDKKDKEETVVQKTVRVLGILILMLITLMLAYLLLQLQAKLRYRHFQRRLEMGNSKLVCGMLYDRVCLIFSVDKIPEDSWFPYENAEDIVEDYGEISVDDYKRFVSLIEKEKFGGGELSQSERHTLRAFMGRLSENSYKNANFWKRLRMKYMYCIHE